jgi:hypothetical protein
MIRRITLLVVLAVGLAACRDFNPNATPVIMFPTRVSGSPIPTFPGLPTQPVSTSGPGFPTQPPFPTVALPSPTPPPEQGWFTIRPNWPGVVWRNTTFRNGQNQAVGVVIVRVDRNYVNLRVHHAPNQAGTIQQWQGALPTALVIINANFFDTAGRPQGVVVTDGRYFGTNITRSDAGIFIVQNGQPRVRSLWLEPIKPQERFEQASQAYPILMAYGQVAPINPDVGSVSAPRTVIAQDRQGRILLIVTTYAGVRLAELANWLGRASGLDIDMALNLDGGASTGMYLATNPTGIGQFVPNARQVPVVIAVYPK